MSTDTWPTEEMIEAAGSAALHMAADWDCPKKPGVPRTECRYCIAEVAVRAALDAAPKEWSVDRGVPLRPFRRESHARQAAADWRLRDVDAHVVYRTAAGPWTREDPE